MVNYRIVIGAMYFAHSCTQIWIESSILKIADGCTSLYGWEELWAFCH